METVSESKEKGMLIERNLLQLQEIEEGEELENQSFSFLICGKDGICIKKTCEVNQKNNHQKNNRNR